MPILIRAILLAKRLARVILHYSWGFNFLILLGALIWSYYFAQTYFVKTQKDYRFIQDNISNISYAELDSDTFARVLQSYQEKINYQVDVSVSPLPFLK